MTNTCTIIVEKKVLTTKKLAYLSSFLKLEAWRRGKKRHTKYNKTTTKKEQKKKKLQNHIPFQRPKYTKRKGHSDDDCKLRMSGPKSWV